MNNKEQITPSYSFDKSTYVKFLDRTDFRLAKYNDISLEGFSCFCNKPMEMGEKFRVEINLKMMSGGLIDDIEMQIATAELTGQIKIGGKTVYQFKFVDFMANCFDNLVKAVDYLDHKEKLISLPDISKNNVEAQSTISDIVKDLSENIKKGQISLPVLPKIIQDVEDVIKNPNSNGDDIAKVIEQDAVISVKLISLANSSFYRGSSHIVTVKETIPRLGMKEVQNLVLTIANKSLYNAKNKPFKQLLEKLWLHSLACAFNAKAIALKTGFQNIDSFFTMGLVHDIGMTMLLRILGEMTNQNKTFDTNDIIESINEHQAYIGELILKFWNFSDDFISAATMYKDPHFDLTTNKEILIINLADCLTNNIGYGIKDDDVDPTSLESAKLLEISPDILNQIAETTRTSMVESSGDI